MGSCNILSVYKSQFRTSQPECPFAPGSVPGAEAWPPRAGLGLEMGSVPAIKTGDREDL